MANTTRSCGVYRGRATCRPININWCRNTAIPTPQHPAPDVHKRERANHHDRQPAAPCRRCSEP